MSVQRECYPVYFPYKSLWNPDEYAVEGYVHVLKFADGRSVGQAEISDLFNQAAADIAGAGLERQEPLVQQDCNEFLQREFFNQAAADISGATKSRKPVVRQGCVEFMTNSPLPGYTLVDPRP